MASEFDLIDNYFCGQQSHRDDVILAQGDDCAIVSCNPDQQIVISTDTVVVGTHFLADAPPAWVAHKALASNLSDLAAMGAKPAWVSMAITLPHQDLAWLKAFCDSFFSLANQHNLQLIGGDTTKGPLAVSLTIQGIVPRGSALLRSGAKDGDIICVTGNLGDSHAGLEVILDTSKRHLPHAPELERRHFVSISRVALAQQLRGIASSCIDISDGLVSDIRHIMKRSGVGASIDVMALPVSNELSAFSSCAESEYAAPWQYALCSGEEYELCFTVAPDLLESVQSLSNEIKAIGRVNSSQELHLHRGGERLDYTSQGFDHFRES
ncbi:thiamine-phosphate kinase [Vibrio gallicus]|uniref:thiamine-phosphate kinase n=1 Tax=Vibrio gallicus TaxID=190897 RepID=UPI0021C3D1EF|nr:thiamine-phosphate kinase [Vibrio gallicus]